ETKLGVTPLEGLNQVRVAVGAADRASRLARTRRSLVAFFETLRLALDSLRAHKLRSFLTLLGVILAVTTLVAVMSVVSGMNFYVADRIANLGANVFIVDWFGMIRGAGVAFIGADVAAKLYPNVDPIGKTFRAETHEYQVIGVATPIGSAFGQSQDNFVIMPIHTYQKEFHRQNDWVGIFIQAPSAELMDASKDEARMLMRAHRHLPYEAPDNFAILGSDSIMALWHDLTGTLATVAIGLVS